MVGDSYRGLIALDMLTSAGAMVSVWWMLRAFIRPATAAAATLVLGVGPLFWGYGSIAGNYTAIVLVGALLIGIAYRGQVRPMPWHPYATAVGLGIGAGYRQDIGTFWLGVFLVILWQHRWKRSLAAGTVFGLISLAWLAAMLNEAGGWQNYRAASGEFAYQCGYLNSIWHLGFVDAPVRYLVKLTMALVWTLGPALLLTPLGCLRLRRLDHGIFLMMILALPAVPVLGSHLLVHFGSPGWCFHYVPALIVLAALGAGALETGRSGWRDQSEGSVRKRSLAAPASLVAVAGILAGVFLFYPTDFDRAGWRGAFDLAFCRFTRTGLQIPMFNRSQAYWRTANSRSSAGDSAINGSSLSRTGEG